VQVQVQAGGDAELTKLLTAAKAGNPPDLAQVEYQALPTLVSNNYLANIASYAGNLKSDFPAGNWNQVTLGTSSVYGIPQDAAPMALFYRADLFKKYHLAVPTTWEDFAADAAKLHKEAPGVFLGTFSSVDPGEFAGLTQRREPEGRLLLAVAGRFRRGRQPAAVDGRVEQEHERREVHRVGLRRLGARRHADRIAGEHGQVGDGPAATVDRGRERRR
jgi:hypothetical protein